MNTCPRLTCTLSILVAAFCLAVSATAHAQSVAGTVRDTSGAVLPGVAVEATQQPTHDPSGCHGLLPAASPGPPGRGRCAPSA